MIKDQEVFAKQNETITNLALKSLRQEQRIRELLAVITSIGDYRNTVPFTTAREFLEHDTVVIPDNQPQFTVQVGTMHESHRVTYWVQIFNNFTRPEESRIWDSIGYMTPYMTEVKEQAEYTAQEWAEFLGVTVTVIDLEVKDEAPTTISN